MKSTNVSQKSAPARRWVREHFSYSQWRVWKFEGSKSYAMKYIYWLEDRTNPRMTLGKQVAEMIEHDRTIVDDKEFAIPEEHRAIYEHLRIFLPQYPLKEFPLRPIFNGIKLYGKPDGLDLDKKIVGEHKTGVEWNQAMSDATDPMRKFYKEGAQLTWYALLLHLAYGWKPEDIRIQLNWMPTIWEPFQLPRPTGEIKIFETRRTTRNILDMGKDIIDTHKAIGEFCAKELAAIGK